MKRFIVYILPLILHVIPISCSSDIEPLPVEDKTTIPQNDYVNRAEEFKKLKGWKFRCKVYGEVITVNDYGGRIEFMKKVDTLLATASKAFCINGINNEGDNQVHFYMTEMETFSGLSKSIMYQSKDLNDLSFDLKIIINDHPSEEDVSESWLGPPNYAISHNREGLFGKYAIESLIHELGHSRGMADIYATEIRSSMYNPVNHSIFEGVRGRMNNSHSDFFWSEYSLLMINANKNRRAARTHFDFLPEKIKATVTKWNGDILTGAKMRFYPVYSYSYKVTPTPLYEGSLDSDGYFIFDSHPFTKRGNKHSMNIFNYLVEAEYNGRRSYAWMPIYEAELAGLKGEDTYVFSLHFIGY